MAPGDAGTLGTTIPILKGLVREGRVDPVVLRKARQLTAAAPQKHPVQAIHDFVRSLPYAFDEDLAARRGYPADTSEVLQGARSQIVTAENLGPQAAEGDCDCRCVLAQSMLESLGYPTRFAIVKGPGRGDYSHVYSEVQVESGGWVPVDTIMNGEGGRPFFEAGEEVQAPLARDKATFGVDESDSSGWLLPLALFGVLALRR